MTCVSYPRIGLSLQDRRPPWLMFLCLTAVFFFAQHDLSYSKRGMDNLNLTAEEVIAFSASGSLGHRIALISLGIVAVVSLARDRTNDRFRIDGPLGWLLLCFGFLALFSPIWADDPPLTIRSVAVLGILCIIAAAVVRRLSLREIILWTLFSTALYLSIGICAEVYFGEFRPFAYGYRFAGTQHPNAEGIECGLLLLSAVAAADLGRRRRVLFWTCAIVGFVFLVLSGSRTALAATILALITYLASVRSRRWKVSTALGFSMISCFFLLFLGVGLLPSLKSTILLGRNDPANVDTFTGRTMIWKDVGYFIRQRPLLGYGYDGFWTPTHIRVISDEENGGVSGSHSAYLEYLLTLGTVGLVAYTLSLFGGIRRAFRFHNLTQRAEFAFCGALLAFCALDGFLESTVAIPTLLMFLWMVVLTRLAFFPALAP